MEMEWLEDILSWPAEWSALHGIAELKTPILKMTTRAEATAWKDVVRWNGSRYPDEGARGVNFPYQAPNRCVVSSSRGFERGLRHIEVMLPDRPAWYHEDNGFSSRTAMEAPTSAGGEPGSQAARAGFRRGD
jgi:hypothetical protein